MNNRFISAILIGTLMTLMGCTKDGIDEFPDERYVQFTTNLADTVSVSFFFYPNQDQIQYPVPMQLIGRVSEQDLTFQIAVDEAATTAQGQHYALPEQFVFRAGLMADTIYLTVNKTPEMDTETFQLALQIVPTDETLPGQSTFTRKILRLNNMTSRPTWWDSNMESQLLGAYTDRKFQLFIEVTGVNDLSIYDSSEQRDFMLQFKYYLIEKRDADEAILEEDGTDMLSTVRIIG